MANPHSLGRLFVSSTKEECNKIIRSLWGFAANWTPDLLPQLDAISQDLQNGGFEILKLTHGFWKSLPERCHDTPAVRRTRRSLSAHQITLALQPPLSGVLGFLHCPEPMFEPEPIGTGAGRQSRFDHFQIGTVRIENAVRHRPRNTSQHAGSVRLLIAGHHNRTIQRCHCGIPSVRKNRRTGSTWTNPVLLKTASKSPRNSTAWGDAPFHCRIAAARTTPIMIDRYLSVLILW